jgi:hypothetical protein
MTRSGNDKCGKWGHVLYQYQGEKGDKEEKDLNEKKKQENNKKEKESEDKPKSKGLISTLALSSISCLERGRRISYLDSGASNYISSDRHRLLDFTPAMGYIRIARMARDVWKLRIKERSE